MSKLLAALIPIGLIFLGVNAYAGDATTKNDGTFKLAMDNSMRGEKMSSPLSMGGVKKVAAKKNKKHHKHKVKRSHVQ